MPRKMVNHFGQKEEDILNQDGVHQDHPEAEVRRGHLEVEDHQGHPEVEVHLDHRDVEEDHRV